MVADYATHQEVTSHSYCKYIVRVAKTTLAHREGRTRSLQIAGTTVTRLS
jgi:hypothetical protein